MKLIKSLFLFGFIILHTKIAGNSIWFNVDHIASITDSLQGVNVRTVGVVDPFTVRESFDEITNMISQTK